MDSIDLIEILLAKPYLYTCGESLIALRTFLNGYAFCRIENQLTGGAKTAYSLLPADWGLFTEYVRCSLTYDEPNADWFDILMTYFGDKEGYRMFVNYFDSYRRLEISSYKRANLTEEQQRFYSQNSGKALVPLAYYVADINRGACYLAACEFDKEVHRTARVYKTEEEALADAEKLFGGELSWFGVTGVEELNFRKPVRLYNKKI
ncbi:hypothetical protein [Ruminococcus albus]|uniref:Uncharacterized protein n=1 Tax=Ruminococcus albus TaxID=1264 RepID=A0A1H7L808_RUMAL|nr:hypothetical protein [Ruminococcus albus]SEK94876.1 hypothetical protein SAMN05216469_10888 [Ruminococcus albus]